ncbi:MAG TPA: putative metal-dependent hydrolase [Solibacterales bacterium]|nr:putative metal-dependent hydrolase [Bryobacterales bacterium]
MSDPRYPIGKFHYAGPLTPAQRAACIDDIAGLPGQLRSATGNLSDAALDQPYREGGWTVRQVVHHVADSHMHAYARFKFGLTQANPPILAYNEAVWAKLVDARTLPVAASLALLDGLHARWSALLRSLDTADWQRTYVHPENGSMTLDRTLALYAWHGRHHLAHILGVPGRAR